MVFVLGGELANLEQHARENTLTITRYLQNLVYDDARSKNWDAIQRNLFNLEQAGDAAHFQIVDVKGNVLVDSYPEKEQRLLQPAFLAQVLALKQPLTFTSEKDVYLGVIPMFDSQDNIFVISVVQVDWGENFRDFRRDVFLRTGLIDLGVLLVLLMSMLVFWKMFLAPLRQIVRFAESGQGNLMEFPVREMERIHQLLEEHRQTQDQIQRLYESECEQRHLAQKLREAGALLGETLDLDIMLKNVLEGIEHLIPCDVAAFFWVENNIATMALTRGKALYEDDLEKERTITYEASSTYTLRTILETRQPLLVKDTMAEEGWVQLEGVRRLGSWIGAPVVTQERVIAYLSVGKDERDFYTSQQVDLLATYAGQMALALQNAQNHAGTLETLERERRLNEVTRAISSALDLKIILQNVVRLAVMLVGADAGALGIISENKLVYSHSVDLFSTSGFDFNLGDNLAWQVVQTREPVWLPDFQPIARDCPGWAVSGANGYIGVPLLVGGSCLGVLVLLSCAKLNRFEDRDLELAESVARQAGVAIQNARLFEETQRRAQESEALRIASNDISAALDLNEVLERVLGHLGRVINYDYASIYLLKDEELPFAAGMDSNGDKFDSDVKLSLEDPFIQKLSMSPEAFLYHHPEDEDLFPSILEIEGYQSWMVLPLVVRESLVGILCVGSRQAGQYRGIDTTLVQTFASEAAVSIENAQLFSKVQLFATTDALTGLYNRRYFFDAADHEYLRWKRYKNPFSIVILDIDFFKRVNDTYGHLVGDRVLMLLAQRLHESLRDVDILARYGGEEFVALLAETGDESASRVAERLCASISREAFDTGEQNVNITVSIGVASLEDSCESVEELIQRADSALYTAKNSGRSRVIVWSKG